MMKLYKSNNLLCSDNDITLSRMDIDTQEVKATSTWTFAEDKLFESALLSIPEGMVGWWQKLADAVPGKTVDQVRAHYEALLHDLHAIESDLVSISYPEEEENESSMSCDSEMTTSQILSGTTNGSKQGERERKKGTPWTMEEHRKFLEGLKIYGKGDWRSISRNCVITRTATQVASHAQKYFIRQESPRKEKKRASIHDITITDTTMVVQPPLLPLPPQPNIYGEQGGVRGGAPQPNIYGEQGGGRGGAPPQPNIYGEQGGGRGGAPPLPNFYSEQGGGRGGAPPHMGYQYQQNVWYPV